MRTFYRIRRLLIVSFIAVGLIWWGGQEIETARHNRKATPLSMKGFTSAKTDAKWLELSDCALGIESAMHNETDDHVWQLYIPVYATGDDERKQVQVLLVTQDSELKQLYQSLSTIDDEGKARALLTANRDRLRNRTLHGVVRQGDDKEVKQLVALDSTLAPGFLLLEDGAQPSLKLGVILLLAGLLIAGLVVGWLVLGLRRWQLAKKQPVSSATVPGSVAPRA